MSPMTVMKEVVSLYLLHNRKQSFIIWHLSDELGSDEESGKDWSDLEREAAEEDRNHEGGVVPKPTSNHRSDNKHRR